MNYELLEEIMEEMEQLEWYIEDSLMNEEALRLMRSIQEKLKELMEM